MSDSSSLRTRPDEICVRALWEILQISGADVSEYAHETRTAEGREAGFKQWMRSGSVEEVVEAVRQLRSDYDGEPFCWCGDPECTG